MEQTQLEFLILLHVYFVLDNILDNISLYPMKMTSSI